MDSTVVIGCAGGCIDYRLSRSVTGLYQIEERHIEESPGGDSIYSSWKRVGLFKQPEQAWDWVGSKLGWTAE